MRKENSCFTIILLFFVSLSYAQKEFTNWYFGDRAGLYFSDEGVSALNNGLITSTEACATISDALGNLLFYTNGINVWDKNHNIMPNGQDINNLNVNLNVLYSTQGAVIVPRPNHPNIYFIFTAPRPFESDGLRYSQVNMDFNNGLGDIVNSSVLLNTNPIVGKITVVQHANNKDFWVITHGQGSSVFYVYKVDEDGVSNQPLTFNIGSVHDLGVNSKGAMKVSPDATKIAVAASGIYPGGFLEIFDFNDETGEIYGDVLKFDDIFLEDYGSPYGVEFSPSGQYLYISDNNHFIIDGIQQPNSVYQLDLSYDTVEEIKLNRSTIITKNEIIGLLQLGYDDRIYVSWEETSFLDVIDSPNMNGSSSNYLEDEIPLVVDDLDNQKSSLGLPQDIRNFFYFNLFSSPICGETGYEFYFETNEDPISVEWDFGDGSTSADFFTTHQFASGNYEITLTANYPINDIVKTFNVTIPDNLNIQNELSLCDDISNDGIIDVNLMTLTESVFRNEDCGLISYHISQVDAITNSNPLNEIYQNISNPQTIYLRLEQELNTNNVTISPITINVDAFPSLIVDSLMFCDENNTGNKDLSIIQLNSEIFNGDLNCATITYHSSSSDANTGANAFMNSIQITLSTETIFIRIEDANTGNYIVEPLSVNLKPKPILNITDSFFICLNESVEVSLDTSYDFYNWSTGETTSSIEIDEVGSYSVTVINITDDGFCSDTALFNVLASDVPETINFSVTDLSSNNKIQVIVDGIGDYEYSLDGVNYQESPIFNNLQKSQYTVFVRDVNGCGMVSKDAFLLVFPKFFTPNDDGVNDLWQVKTSFNEPDIEIEIFNRYGKLLASFNGSSSGWDGTFKGVDLPNSDYWFKIKRPSKNKIYKGHFTLKR
jgi:gliding motility-associated-like protein